MAYYSHLFRLHAHRPEFQNLSRFSREGNPQGRGHPICGSRLADARQF
jgi:hypothetical protein